MSGSLLEWLALREPLDMRARNGAVLDAVAAACGQKPSMSIVDLASGTGSTVRALATTLPTPQHWKLVDKDPVLLAKAFATRRQAGVSIETQQFDLNGDLGPLLDDGIDLITASALIDLVSEPWLANLAAAAAARLLPVYIALTYDGRLKFSRLDPDDASIVAAFNAHQLTNKGFGPALGPRAAASAERIFRTLGYSFVSGYSDWVAEPEDAEFQLELLADLRRVAHEMGGHARDAADSWFARRCQAVTTGQSTLSVGHVDFFAQPPKR